MGNPSGAQATRGECCIKPRRHDRLAYCLFCGSSFDFQLSPCCRLGLHLGMVVRLGRALLKAVRRKVVVVRALLVTVPAAYSSETRSCTPQGFSYAPPL